MNFENLKDQINNMADFNNQSAFAFLFIKHVESNLFLKPCLLNEFNCAYLEKKDSILSFTSNTKPIIFINCTQIDADMVVDLDNFPKVKNNKSLFIFIFTENKKHLAKETKQWEKRHTIDSPADIDSYINKIGSYHFMNDFIPAAHEDNKKNKI